MFGLGGLTRESQAVFPGIYETKTLKYFGKIWVVSINILEERMWKHHLVSHTQISGESDKARIGEGT